MTVKQDCTRCPHQQKCWGTHTNTGKPVSPRNILINVLVCRLQLGIDKEKAAAGLISMYRPGMMRLISNAKSTYNDNTIDSDQVFMEMSSAAIELMQHDYRIGDRGRLTPYLFDLQQGFLTKWVKWFFNKHRKFYIQHELYSPTAVQQDDYDDDGESIDNLDTADTTDGWSTIIDGQRDWDNEEYADRIKEMISTILDIIDDGVTLNSNEYRAMKFCLSNGNEANASRHIDGLHIYLAKLMGVSRPRVTRLFKRAKQKIIAKYYRQVKDE